MTVETRAHQVLLAIRPLAAATVVKTTPHIGIEAGGTLLLTRSRYRLAVSNFEMPQGLYLSTAIGLSPDAGGQTRAMLMRNRIFAEETGVRPTVITFGAIQHPEELRSILLDRGMLTDDLCTLNIYEHYRDHGWGDTPATAEPAADLSRFKTHEDFHGDGSPWRVRYDVPGPKPNRVYDYLRSDGSPYLRISPFQHASRRTWPDRILQLDKSGEVVGHFNSVGDWYRRWIRELAVNDERAFVFIDTRRLVPHIAPMRAPHIHLIYLMHNVHMASPRNWNSPVNDVYQRVLNRIGALDAMVTLTHRQQEDIAERRGCTNNLFVVPNPVDLPPRPVDVPHRDPHRVTIVARLSPQKRLGHALAVFQRVLEVVPEARLDIFGDGPDRPGLEAEALDRRIDEQVTFHGHDPHAKDALWKSSVFLMTSSFEGYPLSTLESMSRGCPVVSYDIKYGPREQISDGVDGYLVPSGDIESAAAKVIELLRSPEQIERMGLAAREKAAKHGTYDFLADWSNVLQKAIQNKPLRTHINSGEFELTRLRSVHSKGFFSRLLNRGRDFTPTVVPSDGRLEIAGKLHITGSGREESLDTAQISIAAVHDASGTVEYLPVHVRRTGRNFSVRSDIRLADILTAFEDHARIRIRLRIVWENRSWETWIEHPHRRESSTSVAIYRRDTGLELASKTLE